MSKSDRQNRAHLLRALPSIDALLRTTEARRVAVETGAAQLTVLARRVTEEMRAELLVHTNGEASPLAASREEMLAEAARRLTHAAHCEPVGALRRVINATGVILHTNLGRAPLAVAARDRMARVAASYCTLEYDLDAGQRGRRGVGAESLLCAVTGAEAALIVNNCAAAALLILTALARGGETIVSRGELVEIGGDFRVPDVMAQSGTRLVEVGTTNRTHLADYQQAISEQTRLMMRVHPSNYRIIGFTAAPPLAELTAAAHAANLPFYEDAGSGALLDLAPYGVDGEPVISSSIAAGVDLVSFSGDKLLGGAQSGLIVGRRELIERLRKEPLYRALRADKLALGALEATLELYARGRALEEVPALRMLTTSLAELRRRAQLFLTDLRESDKANSFLLAEIIDGQSAIGGGSAPTSHPPAALIALKHRSLAANAFDQKLRRTSPPIIARIAEERVLIDLRTVEPSEEKELLTGLLIAASS